MEFRRVEILYYLDGALTAFMSTGLSEEDSMRKAWKQMLDRFDCPLYRSVVLEVQEELEQIKCRIVKKHKNMTGMSIALQYKG